MRKAARVAENLTWQIVGPLAMARGIVVSDADGAPRFRRQGQPEHDSRTAAAQANARLILHRTAVVLVHTDPDTGEQRLRELDDRPVRTWAVETDLGQRRSDNLGPQIAARRARALSRLAGAPNRQVIAIEIEPQAAVVTGTATGGLRNVGIELHGTHGWPIIPASSLKGVAAAYAAEVASPEDLDRIFGSPRPGREKDSETSEKPGARPGTVQFFDALPGPDGVTVAQHDLTPHARAYHTGIDSTGSRPVPAEYLSPVPIPFLVVDGGSFTAHVAGPADDAAAAARLLCEAMDDLGVGAKTSAGYGYLTGTARVLDLPVGGAAR